MCYLPQATLQRLCTNLKSSAQKKESTWLKERNHKRKLDKSLSRNVSSYSFHEFEKRKQNYTGNSKINFIYIIYCVRMHRQIDRERPLVEALEYRYQMGCQD